MTLRKPSLWLSCLIGALALPLVGCAHLVILHDPLTANEHNDLGVVYETRGELGLAKKEYRKALRLDSRDSRARVNLGNVAAAGNDWRSAEKQYRRALSDSSTNYDAMNNLAVALLRQGRNLDEATKWAESAAAVRTGRDSVYRVTLSEVRAARR